jgi:hypothetical protein
MTRRIMNAEPLADLIEAAEQLVFQLADDPGDFRGGPVVLDGPDDGHHVSRVAQR